MVPIRTRTTFKKFTLFLHMIFIYTAEITKHFFDVLLYIYIYVTLSLVLMERFDIGPTKSNYIAFSFTCT